MLQLLFFVGISAGLNFHVKKWQQKKKKKTHLEYIFILMWMAGIVFILLIKIVPRYTLKYSIFDRFYYSQQLINLNHIGHSSASYSNSTVLKWWQILLNICGNWQAFTLMHAFSYFFFLYELRLMVIKHILLLYYFLLTVVNQCLHVILFCFQYSFVYLKKKYRPFYI